MDEEIIRVFEKEIKFKNMAFITYPKILRRRALG